MDLNPGDWELTLANPAINYRVDDHQLGVVIGDEPPPPRVTCALMIDAEHLETGLLVRLAIRLAPLTVYQLAVEFPAIATELRAAGVLPGADDSDH